MTSKSKADILPVMKTYVLRYKPAFQAINKARSERFPAASDTEAMHFALTFVNRRGLDFIVLWEETHVDSDMSKNGHTELRTVYSPAGLNA